MSYTNAYLFRLQEFCETRDYFGWDPYDGLNSEFFRKTPFSNHKIPRIIWTQLLKSSPLNLRKIFSVPQGYNPKALGLFLSGYVNLQRAQDSKGANLKQIEHLAEKLLELRSKGYDNRFCWGYNFDWQSRAFFLPRFTPNVIVSVFVGNAFLDLFSLTKEKRYLDIARSVCEFLLKDLNRSWEGEDFCFSYSPKDKSRIFNASMLASRFLARTGFFLPEEALNMAARKSLDFCVRYQEKEGGWVYGMDANQRWIDSYHTGYILESLYDYQLFTREKRYEPYFEKGLNFYLLNFFTPDGLPRLYPHKHYPVDIHSAAEALILLSRPGLIRQNHDLIDKILGWTIKNMWNERGYFYYKVNKFYKIKAPFMRWSCSWMFYALSCLAAADEEKHIIK